MRLSDLARMPKDAAQGAVAVAAVGGCVPERGGAARGTVVDMGAAIARDTFSFVQYTPIANGNAEQGTLQPPPAPSARAARGTRPIARARCR
jgi:hypothetical protein